MIVELGGIDNDATHAQIGVLLMDAKCITFCRAIKPMLLTRLHFKVEVALGRILNVIWVNWRPIVPILPY